LKQIDHQNFLFDTIRKILLISKTCAV